MSTLPIRAPYLPRVWSLAVFARVLSFLIAMLYVFAEAREMARMAHKRYPFADW